MATYEGDEPLSQEDYWKLVDTIPDEGPCEVSAPALKEDASGE